MGKNTLYLLMHAVAQEMHFLASATSRHWCRVRKSNIFERIFEKIMKWFATTEVKIGLECMLQSFGK